MDHPSYLTQTLSHLPSKRLVSSIILGVWAITLMTGQLVRVPVFGQSGGLLPSDVANSLVIMYAFCLYAMKRKSVGKTLGVNEKTPSVEETGASKARWAFIAIAPFLLWSLFVLFLHIGELSGPAMLIALAYWARVAVILGLLPAFLMILRQRKSKKIIPPLILIVVGTIAALGYIQLFLYPSLQNTSGGWDPHRGRMLGTWLDPNFFGVFLGLTLPYVIATMRKPAQIIFGSIILFAIILTQSRSTFVAIVVAAIVCVPLFFYAIKFSNQAKKLVTLGSILVLACAALATTLLGDRAINILLHDPTSSIRIDGYKTVWRSLVETNILFGVGYNAYQFAAKEAGVIADFGIHSRAGSDSSILTLLVTTGVFGTALFMFPMAIAAAKHARRFLQTQHMYSLCFIWATIVLIIHSQFTNSLLYPHLLMTYMFLAAISSVYDT